LVGHHLQQALDSAAWQAEQERLVRQSEVDHPNSL
jgi:hypothetical protein